jgi:membrane associated rhomboid family serine protease
MTYWVTRLIAINVGMFLLAMLAKLDFSPLVFVPALILQRPWTLITYMFLHAGLWHLFFNMLGLFFFGPRLEVFLGSRQFLLLYFISGLTGALLSFLLTPNTAIIGASGGVFGVFLGFAYYWPRERIFIYGILPVEARWLIVGMTVMSIFGIGGTNVAHFAHLGGFLGAFLYLRWLSWQTRLIRERATVARTTASAEDIQRWTRIPRDRMHEVNRAELDRILNKLSTSGVGSLTNEERMFLDRFSAP